MTEAWLLVRFDGGGTFAWAAPAALFAAVNAPILGPVTVGRPVAVPCTWIFAALTTWSAARLMLPETRMPA